MHATGSDTKPQALIFAAVAAVVALIHALVRVWPRHPMADLEVYRMGSVHLLAGDDNLYALTYVGPDLALPYTYPPFSTLAFVPLSFGSSTLAGILMAVIMISALARVSWLIASNLPGLARWSMLIAALAIFVLGWAGEPGRTMFGLGQVATILAWLVVEDWLGIGSRRRSGGVLTGLATGIKLIPGIFIALAAILGQWRRAVVAAMAAVATVLLGVALLPESSLIFWTGTGFNASRVGGVDWIGNQSLNALAWRTVDPGARQLWWLLSSAAVGGLWIYLVRRYWRDGDRVGVVLLTAMTSLLVSPVSWTHHWVWLAPISVWLWVTAGRDARASLRFTGWALSAASALVMVTGPVQPGSGSAWFELGGPATQWVLGQSYVLVGILVLGWAVWHRWAPSPEQPTSTGGNADHFVALGNSTHS